MASSLICALDCTATPGTRGAPAPVAPRRRVARVRLAPRCQWRPLTARAQAAATQPDPEHQAPANGGRRRFHDRAEGGRRRGAGAGSGWRVVEGARRERRPGPHATRRGVLPQRRHGQRVTRHRGTERRRRGHHEDERGRALRLAVPARGRAQGPRHTDGPRL